MRRGEADTGESERGPGVCRQTGETKKKEAFKTRGGPQDEKHENQRKRTDSKLQGELRVYVDWVKCAGGLWCPFDYIDLSKIRAHGVYVIWKPSGGTFRHSAVVRVGNGDIASRLAAHRMETAINRHGPDLLVTWAEVAGLFSGGVEVYLAQQLRPLVGQRFPLAVPVEVNLPISA